MRRLNLQVTSQLSGVKEILVARDIDPDQLVQRTGIYVVDDVHYFGVGFLPDLNLGVKPALCLQVVQKVGAALIQQVIVDGIFFVDRNLALQLSTADVVPLSGDQNDRAGVDLISEIKGVVLRVVDLLRNGNLCQRTILLLKLPPEAL